MLPNGKDVMIELLKDAWVCVILDPRRDGVQLPLHLRSGPRLSLEYGYNMPVPIPDLVIDDAGIRATLSFQRAPHQTVIPWSAVYALHDGDKRGMVWPEDVPKDIETAQFEPPEPLPTSAPKPDPFPPLKSGKRPRPSHLKLVP